MKIAKSPNLTLPIALASVTVPLSILVLIGWVVVVLRNQELSQRVTTDVVMLSGGIISIIIITAALIILAIFLGREILEGRRQVRFIDSVTHELKSPLASLRLSVETLSRPDMPENRRSRLHQMMVDDIDRLGFFIDDILEASRTANVQDAANQNLNVMNVLRDCRQRVCARHKISTDSVTISAPEDLSIFCSPTALNTIVRNLLDNAIKYSTAPREIAITVSTDPKYAVFIVKDNGIGMDAGVRRQVFHRFYRSVSPEVRARSGTGIGLYVVAQLIRNMGGTIEALSDGAGRGSVFRVQLPVPLETRSPG